MGGSERKILYSMRCHLPSHISAAPWEVHLKRLVKIFGYLQNVSGKHKIVVVLPDNTGEISGKGVNIKDWLENYQGATEEIYEGLLEPQGCRLSTLVYLDSNHAHD